MRVYIIDVISFREVRADVFSHEKSFVYEEKEYIFGINAFMYRNEAIKCIRDKLIALTEFYSENKWPKCHESLVEYYYTNMLIFDSCLL